MLKKKNQGRGKREKGKRTEKLLAESREEGQLDSTHFIKLLVILEAATETHALLCGVSRICHVFGFCSISYLIKSLNPMEKSISAALVSHILFFFAQV